MIRYYFIFLCSLILAAQGFSQSLGIEEIATGFTRPLAIEQPQNEDRLYIAEQGGLIKITTTAGVVNDTPFLDIRDLVSSSGNERGLLGLTFDPNYASNGYFYVNYTKAANGDSQISRFTRSTTHTDLANPDSEKPILNLTQSAANHNGGCLAFGPDGYLYIALGDGGGGGDPNNWAQQTTNLYGSLVRIDVNTDTNYEIPEDNPFISGEGRDEIWAYGLRNPWKFSFDTATNSIWIADVGQGVYEEINTVSVNQAGVNYGWRCYEANSIYNDSGCPDASNLTFPVADYNHSNNRCSITGGYVYRGSEFEDLIGKYIFADFCSNELGFLNADGSDNYALTFSESFGGNNFSSFGVDNSGTMYVSGISSGTIYKIIDTDDLGIINTQTTAFKLYPNPTSGLVTLQVSSTPKKSELLVHDLLGKLVYQTPLIKNQEKQQIDVSSLKRGVYLIELKQGNKKSSFQKLIIQ